MIDPFPQEWELNSLFASEPTLRDLNLPWSYNHLTFRRVINENKVDCEIEPGFEFIEFTWVRNEATLVVLTLNHVWGLYILDDPEREGFRASVRIPHLLNLDVQIWPAVAVRWGIDASL